MSDFIDDKYKGWIKQHRPEHISMFDDPDFGKCHSCKYQIEPLRMCYWREKGDGSKVVYLKCPRWERKEE